IGLYRYEIVVAALVPVERPLSAGPLFEELAHVGHEVPDDGKVSQRRYGERVFFKDLVDVGPAGPARHAVHGHGAGAAHADAAGEAVGERWVQLALDVGDYIQHGLAGMARNVELLETGGSFDRDLQADSYKRVRTNSRWPSASAAVSRPLA